MSSNDDTNIDLNFFPDWARKPAGLNISVGSDRRTRRDRGSLTGNETPAKKSRQGRKQIASGKQRSANSFSASSESDYNRHHARQIQVPVQISFIPERRGVKPVARWLAQTRKAYSLIDVAAMFLSKPEYFAVKLEAAAPEEGSSQTLMYQCAVCKAVFLNKQEAVAHILSRHFSQFYEKDEVNVEPPAGNFMSVARCGLSGKLLAPPNYHGYNDNVQEVHRSLFSNMSLDEYRNHIVNETDQALIVQWRKEAACQIRYRTVKTDNPLIFTRRSELDVHFLENHAAYTIREGNRFIIPGAVICMLGNGPLSKAIHESWNKGKHFPLKMSIAIYPAFKHLGLYIFKTHDKTAFVTAIQPNSIDPAQTTDVIRCILEYLGKHSEITRHDLIENLRPDAKPESPEIAGIINQLHWLIDKGHVIEFYNGKLTLPHRKAVSRTLVTTNGRADKI